MKKHFWLVLILIMAAILRLWDLGAESFWLDEALTLKKIAYNLPDFVRYLGNESQTFLYYTLERIFCQIGGTGEWATRFPSVLYGLSAVYGIFLLSRRLFSPAVGLYSAFLLAINPFAIFYAQDARPYSLFLAVAIFSLYFFLRVMDTGTRGARAGYIIATTAALYSHPLAPLLFGVQAVVWWIYRDKNVPWMHEVRRVLKPVCLTVLLYLPQLAMIFRAIRDKIQGTAIASWIPVPDLHSIVRTVQQYFMLPWTAVFVVAFIAVALIAIWVRKRRLPAALWVPAALIVFFILVPWILSYLLTPLYWNRYTIPALVGFILLLAWALETMPVILRILAVGCLIVLTGIALRGYYTGTDKDPWRETAAEVRALAKPGDWVIVNEAYTLPAFRHYFSPLPDIACSAPFGRADIPAAVDTAARIIFVQAYQNPTGEIRQELQARIAAGRAAVEDKIITEKRRQNPYVYWLPELRVSVFERTPAR
jgi:mannosyltransferase